MSVVSNTQSHVQRSACSHFLSTTMNDTDIDNYCEMWSGCSPRPLQNSVAYLLIPTFAHGKVVASFWISAVINVSADNLFSFMPFGFRLVLGEPLK